MPQSLSSPVILAPHVRAALCDEAARAGGIECCGLLLGDSPKHISEIVKSRNVAENPERHFEIDPVILIAAEKAARTGGRCLIGYYHSHPAGNAAPSATDAQMSAGDGRIWAIIANDEIRLWRNVRGGDVHDMFTEITSQ